MRIRALVIRIIRQFIRDKRSLGMLIVAPILILTLVSVVFSGDEIEPEVGAVNLDDSLLAAFNAEDLSIIEYPTDEAATKAVNQGIIDGFVEMKNNKIEITLEGSDPAVNKAFLIRTHKTIQKMKVPNESSNPLITYINGSEEMDSFDYIGPFLIGFFAFFFVFLIAGVSFLRERTTGTLEKLLSTPLRCWEIVAGYVIGFGVFTTIQSIVIVWFSISVLDIMMMGSILWVLFITCLLSMTALTLGILLSTFAKNELQMIQFIDCATSFFLRALYNRYNATLASIIKYSDATYIWWNSNERSYDKRRRLGNDFNRGFYITLFLPYFYGSKYTCIKKTSKSLIGRLCLKNF